MWPRHPGPPPRRRPPDAHVEISPRSSDSSLKIGEVHEANRKAVGRTILHFDAVESTNETAKELLESDVEEGLVVWADRQAAGRGRHGRGWASPLGGLYASFILRRREGHARFLGLLFCMSVVLVLGYFGGFSGRKYL